LILLHVVDIVSLAEIACVTGGSDVRPLMRDQADRSMRELKALVGDAWTAIREGSPRHEIVKAALELDCQLIVMGTHGRSGLPHLLLGSVAEYVFCNAQTPVLTVRMHQP
jgi:nucleotide-binding universal stress UspA family protein